MSGRNFNPVFYYQVRRLTLRGWEQVSPIDVKELDIIRMYDPHQWPTPPLTDNAGGNTWLAVSDPFIRKDPNTDTHYDDWAVHTRRINPLREIFWRLCVVIGRYKWDDVV